MASPATTAPHSASEPQRAAAHAQVAPGDIAVGVVIGRSSENFDFFVYGIASALVFPTVFFPFAPPLQGALYSFALFALAFLARPVGTIAFMEIQRRWGISTKLTASLFLLGTATVCISFLPSYATLGAWSIWLLAFFRILQGIALGGSWDGLPSLLALNAPKRRRGWYAMLGQLGAPVGFIVAASLFAYLYLSLSPEDFYSWGWRYPFFAAFTINVVALFARLRLVVTDEYVAQYERYELEPAPVGELFRRRGRVVVTGAFAMLASYALFHIVTIFPLSWLTLYADRPIGPLLLVQVVGAVLAIVGVVASGFIADVLGRARTLGAVAVVIAVYSAMAPFLLEGNEASQNAFLLVGFVLLGLSYGQAAGAMASNLGPKYRYTGAALTSDLAWLIGAAFAPLVALGLSARFGLTALTLYLLSGALCTLLALGFNRYLRLRG